MTSVSHRTLRSRIVVAFAGFAVAVAAIFGISTTVFLYTVEDEFFNDVLSEEASVLRRQRPSPSEWGSPRQAWMTVHTSTATMPIDLRSQIEAAPQQREFRGSDGRHYHVRSLSAGTADAATSAWLVGEVSDRLVVRPMRVALLEKWLVVELAILALAIGIALWIARRIARPLTALAERVHHLNPATVSAPILISGADQEVVVVAAAIDAMRDRLDAFVQREQSFTRAASHELRTPLSVIRSATEQALTDPALPSSAQRLLLLALQSATHMERSIASLLALTREESQPPTRTACRILPIVEDVILEHSRTIDDRALSILLDVPRTAALNVTDDLLRLLLANIIGNAVTHAAPGDILVRYADHQLIVSNHVAPGALPPMSRLGEPGVKGDESPGFGLGLSILQRLCDHAGLDVSWQVESDRFQVRLNETAARAA